MCSAHLELGETAKREGAEQTTTLALKHRYVVLTERVLQHLRRLGHVERGRLAHVRWHRRRGALRHVWQRVALRAGLGAEPTLVVGGRREPRLRRRAAASRQARLATLLAATLVVATLLTLLLTLTLIVAAVLVAVAAAAIAATVAAARTAEPASSAAATVTTAR